MGGCLQCDDGFFLSGNECKDVIDLQYISNCAWFGQTQCQLCEKEFFYNGESCQKAGERINGCEYYSFEDHGKTCLQCSLGKVVLDGKCIDQVNNDQNCAHFVDFTCLKCSSGYKFHENMLLSTMLDESNNSYFTIENYLKSQELAFYKPPVLFCKMQNIENCLNYDSEGKCTSCQLNYSLLNQECLIVSKKDLPFCTKLQNINTCSECTSNYFLNPDGNCLPINKHDFCTEYSKLSSKSECIKCETGYYLSQNGLCLHRIDSRIIVECTEYSPKNDTCFACSETTHLTDDNLKCLSKISNCETYLPSSKVSSSLECKACNAGFYFDINGDCVKGNDENCNNFKIYSDVCEKCKDEYFLETNSKTCVKHELSLACISYDPVIRDKCNGHYGNYREIVYGNNCIPINSISKCIKYSKTDVSTIMQNFAISIQPSSEFWSTKHTTTCLECEESFKPSLNGQSCEVIPLDQNCLKVLDSKCILCTEGKTVTSDGTCSDIHPIESSYCENTNSSFMSFGCSICSIDSLPVSPDYSILCLDQSNLDLLENSQDHCDVYKSLSNGSKECISCISGYSLSDGLTDCVLDDTCDWIIKHPFKNFFHIANSDGNFYSYDDYELFGKTSSICKNAVDYPTGITGCHMFAPGIKGKLACIQCKSDKIPIYDITTGTSVSDKNYVKFDSSGNYLTKVTFRQEISECVLNSSVAEITDCDKYYKYNTNQIGCLSCKFGFFGKVDLGQKEITECINTSDCDSSVRYEGLSWEPEVRSNLKFSLGNILFIQD